MVRRTTLFFNFITPWFGFLMWENKQKTIVSRYKTFRKVFLKTSKYSEYSVEFRIFELFDQLPHIFTI